MFEIRFSNNAEKFIKKSDSKLKKRFQHLFGILKLNPLPAKLFDLKKISGKEDTYRIRLSNCRTIYAVYWEQKIIRVLKMEKRKDRTYKF